MKLEAGYSPYHFKCPMCLEGLKLTTDENKTFETFELRCPRCKERFDVIREMKFNYKVLSWKNYR